MKELNEDQWRLLQGISPDVYNSILEISEIERLGGDPRIVDGSKTEQAALPAPQASGLTESQADEVQSMINVEIRKLASAASSATAKVLKKYVANQVKPLLAKIESLESGKADDKQLASVKAELETRIVAVQINARRAQ
jgi:hypothetical protein